MRSQRVRHVGGAFVVLATLLLLPAPSLAASEPDPVVIAIIDSGIRASHDAFAPGQVVAWYDFSNPTPRASDVTWDPLVTEPYDLLGHGTSVASIAAGLEGSGLTHNFAPGAKLAIANVYPPGSTGFPTRWIAAAARWAVDVVEADIIVLSAGHDRPRRYSAGDVEWYESMQYARDRGVLVVTAAGNGVLNVGLVADTSWLTDPRLVTTTLEVGGATGFQDHAVDCVHLKGHVFCSPYMPMGSPRGATKDPEVTSDYEVTAACHTSDTCIERTAGTSFSAPRAASFAAHLLEHARSLGKSPNATELEWLIKQSAFDAASPYPPTMEGYGYLSLAAAQRGRAILEGQAGPSGTAWDARVAYVETVMPAGARAADLAYSIGNPATYG